MPRQAADDPYVYPGTFTLKNKFGLTDPALLRVAEYAVTTQRTSDAPRFPMTLEGFKATHGHLFQDVFSWAGQVRSVGITHPRSAAPFAMPHLIEGSLAKQFRTLGAEGNLKGLDSTDFAAKAAEHIGELNAIHAFRDGNGRTMRLHLHQLAAQAGHQLDITRLPAQAWNDASAISFQTADAKPLAAVISRALDPRLRMEAEAAQTASTLSPDGRLLYAALAEKVTRQMGKLDPAEKADMRRLVAHELVRQEERGGPIVLTPAQREQATSRAPSALPSQQEAKRTSPIQPEPPKKKRR